MGNFWEDCAFGTRLPRPRPPPRRQGLDAARVIEVRPTYPFSTDPESGSSQGSVRLNGEPAEIESVHDPADDPGDWFVRTRGGGVMVLEPKLFGRLYMQDPVTACGRLEFVSRRS